MHAFLRVLPFKRLLIISFISALAVLFWQAGFSAAQAPPPPPPAGGSRCDTITSTTAVFAGFSLPYNIFSSARELLLQVDCNSSGATFNVGRDSTMTIAVWSAGYHYNGSSWIPVTFTGTPFSAGSQWIAGQANAAIPVNQIITGQNYVVAYSCVWFNQEWKCGCKTPTCLRKTNADGTVDYNNSSGQIWQLQAFRQSGGGGGTQDTLDFKMDPDGPGGSMPPQTGTVTTRLLYNDPLSLPTLPSQNDRRPSEAGGFVVSMGWPLDNDEGTFSGALVHLTWNSNASSCKLSQTVKYQSDGFRMTAVAPHGGGIITPFQDTTFVFSDLPANGTANLTLPAYTNTIGLEHANDLQWSIEFIPITTEFSMQCGNATRTIAAKGDKLFGSARRHENTGEVTVTGLEVSTMRNKGYQVVQNIATGGPVRVDMKAGLVWLDSAPVPHADSPGAIRCFSFEHGSAGGACHSSNLFSSMNADTCSFSSQATYPDGSTQNRNSSSSMQNHGFQEILTPGEETGPSSPASARATLTCSGAGQSKTDTTQFVK